MQQFPGVAASREHTLVWLKKNMALMSPFPVKSSVLQNQNLFVFPLLLFMLESVATAAVSFRPSVKLQDGHVD